MRDHSVDDPVLEQLRENVRTDHRYAQILDKRLGRSLDYFMHGLFLSETATRLEVLSRDFYFAHSAIFLNLWKAVTTIVGDSRERDFQSRYKTLGLDYDFFKNNIAWMKTTRDELDVGHGLLHSRGRRMRATRLIQSDQFATVNYPDGYRVELIDRSGK